MDWYDYFPLGPGVNDDEEQDDIWSIWTFDGDDFLKMWLLAWGDHYEELFPVRPERFIQVLREQYVVFSRGTASLREENPPATYNPRRPRSTVETLILASVNDGRPL
ncbi:hypothetical protein QR680_012795 [Steinernema hermaphroditum]|uniref:Uncharacterized protein n=1 Tax=Steinernema hermaphroditum TaxID=289476 RepID=A0AA39M158_9BILA|nr:hypothetical protein QR680_012795 [Steinernema hermaphroditum]